jgi:hypothetical protein
MNTLENFYMQKHQQEGTLTLEQNPGDENALFKIIIPTRLNAQEQQDTDTPNTATNHTVTHSQATRQHNYRTQTPLNVSDQLPAVFNKVIILTSQTIQQQVSTTTTITTDINNAESYNHNSCTTIYFGQ